MARHVVAFPGLSREATAQLRWMMKQLRGGEDRIRRQGQAGQQAIRGYTHALESSVAPIPGQVERAFRSAGADEGAAATSLRDFLSSRGASDASDLATTLRQAGQDTTPTEAVASLGRGTAGERAATGFSGVSRLASDRAGQVGLAREMPGIYALGGQQRSREFAAQTQGQLANYETAVGPRKAALLSDVLNRELQGRIAENTLGLGQQKVAATKYSADVRASATRDAAASRAAAKRQGNVNKAKGKMSTAWQSAQKSISTDAGKLVTRKANPTALPGEPHVIVTKTPYRKAFSQLWGKYDYLLSYATPAGRGQLRTRLKSLIDRALAAQGIAPAPRGPGPRGPVPGTGPR